MKIALIKDIIPVPCANVINTLNHAQSFFKLGHSVEILVVDQFIKEKSKVKKQDAHLFYGLNRSIKIKYFRGIVIYYFIRFKLLWPLIKLIKFFPKLNNIIDPELQISRYCKKKKFDLVYCRNRFRAAYHNISNRIPTILESHNYPIPQELLKIRVLNKNQFFKGIITISPFLARNFIRNGFPKEKILLMEDAVALDQYDQITEEKTELRKRLNIPLSRKIILYSGSLHSDRGIETILKTIKILNNKELSFYFLGGNKKLVRYWEKYINKNEITADIKFLGYKPSAIIPMYLKAVDILLATYSYDVPTFKWMSPLKIFECMGSKTPFITTNIGRMTEICNTNECLLVNPDDPEDLSKKIITLLDDQPLRHKLVINAYQKAKKNTYENRCNRILEFVR